MQFQQTFFSVMTNHYKQLFMAEAYLGHPVKKLY